MTGRERIINVLEGKPVDRIPNAPIIFNNFIDEYHNRENNKPLDSGTKDLFYIEKGIEIYEGFGFDIILRTANNFEYLEEVSDTDGKWQVEKVKEGNDDDWSIKTTIKTPEKILSQKKNYHKATKHEVVQAVTEDFIKTPEDFDQFVKFQPPVRTFNCSHITKAKELLGDKGIVAPWAQGAFNSSSFYRSVNQLIMDPYLDQGFYEKMLEYFAQRMFLVCKQLTDAGADMLCCSGNIANGATAGPNFFKEHVLQPEIDFTKRVKDLGVYYLYHNCGDAQSLYNLYSPIKMALPTFLWKHV